MKKVLVFTLSERQSAYEVGRLKQEAKKAGVEIEHYLYRQLGFEFNNEQSAVYLAGKRIDSSQYSGVWFRVAGTESGKYISARNSLIRILEKDGVFCVNARSYLSWGRMDKIKQHGVYVTNDIPVVTTRVFYSKEQLLASSFEFPLVCKYTKGFQGKSVVKINSRAKLEEYVDKKGEKNLGMYLWQTYLPTRWDLRVIVIGGKAIGAMKRSAVGDEFRSNFSLGGDVDSWKMSEEEKVLAEKTADVCGLDYCGVDIMKDKNGNNYILEVNRACQYKGFEKATGINVARRVLEMLGKSM